MMPWIQLQSVEGGREWDDQWWK